MREGLLRIRKAVKRGQRSLLLPTQEAQDYLIKLRGFDVNAFRRGKDCLHCDSTLYGMFMFLNSLFPPYVGLEEALSAFTEALLLDEQNAIIMDVWAEAREARGALELHKVMALSYIVPTYASFLLGKEDLERALLPIFERPPDWLEDYILIIERAVDATNYLYAVHYLTCSIVKTAERLEAEMGEGAVLFTDKERVVGLSFAVAEDILEVVEDLTHLGEAVRDMFLLYSYAVGFYHEGLLSMGMKKKE